MKSTESRRCSLVPQSLDAHAESDEIWLYASIYSTHAALGGRDTKLRCLLILWDMLVFQFTWCRVAENVMVAKI
jgi:hypothetical protein